MRKLFAVNTRLIKPKLYNLLAVTAAAVAAE